MVSAELVDALVSPATALNALFQKAVADGKIDDFPSIVNQRFSSIFAGDALDQIPLLDTANPPYAYSSLSLVRFRAMIQDTSCSPEMYISSLTDTKCGGWGLESEAELPMALDLHSDFSVLKERDVLWAVSIPGEGHWCSRSYSTSKARAPTSPNNDQSHFKPHKFPIPETGHIAIQLKVYDSSAEELKPTSVHEFVGILNLEIFHSEFSAEEVVPTLHVLFHKQLPKTITSYPSSRPDEPIFNSTRDALIDWISSEALGGDRDAAEWVLLSCISSVESRNPPLFPMSITLSEFTRPSTVVTPTISTLLAEVLSLSVFLPLSLKFINERNFFPMSKEEDLHAGILQVPNDTTIVITETGIAEGSLLEKGLENVQALQEVTKLQTLPYKFPFSRYSFQTDIKFITLTDGKKSLFLDANIRIPLRPDGSADLYKGKGSINWPSQEILASFREFIVHAKSVKVTVDESLSEHIKNEFVQERQERLSTSADDLVRRMNLARLIAHSRLERKMSMDTWIAAKSLETRRLARHG